MLNHTFSPAFERNNVPVVLPFNNLYAPFAGVFIQSLLDHASEERNYDIIILERDISKENKRLLKSLAAGLTNVSVRFYDPSPLFASFNFADRANHYPIEVFYKIAAPHILNYPGRIIVSDVDTLLKTDIARLMDENLKGCCVGGISSAPWIYTSCLFNRMLFPSTENKMKARDYWQNVFGLENWKDFKSYKDYITTALLLFDSEKYVQEVDMETILDTSQQGKFFYSEERVLYVLMKGKIKLLNPAWSVVPPQTMRAVENHKVVAKIFNEIYNDSEAIKQENDDPYLLHWGAKPKPWVCPDVPFGSEWWQTALRTPFVGHIIARMTDELEKRRQYYREKYGKENVDVWDPTPKGIDRTRAAEL